MSALHYGRVEAAADATGRLVYTGTAVEHPLPGWAKPPAGAAITNLIPAQRRAAVAARTAQEGALR